MARNIVQIVMRIYDLLEKKHNIVFFLRHKRFYAITFMALLIITSMISLDTNITAFQSNSRNHNGNFALYQTTNLQTNIYSSSDGQNFNLLGTNEIFASKDFPSMIEKNDWVFFFTIPQSIAENYYLAPQILSKDALCITGYDFIDITGRGNKQWVLKCDLKNSVIVFTLLSIPLSIINELFNEIGNNIRARYDIPFWNEIRFPRIKL